MIISDKRKDEMMLNSKYTNLGFNHKALPHYHNHRKTIETEKETQIQKGLKVRALSQQTHPIYAGMEPASLPSGNYGGQQYLAQVQGPTIHPLVRDITNELDMALLQYTPGNQFNYEQLCKQAFQKKVVNHGASVDLRTQMQKIVNTKFLKFQMKEKEIKKQELKQKRLMEENDHQVEFQNELVMQEQKFINQSRRKRIEPLHQRFPNQRNRMQQYMELGDAPTKQDQYVDNRIQGVENKISTIPVPNFPVGGVNVLNNPTGPLQYEMTNKPSQRQMQPNVEPMGHYHYQQPLLPSTAFPGTKIDEPQDQMGFVSRFSDNDQVKQQRQNMRIMQQKILEQQIQEKKMRQSQQKRIAQIEEIKLQNRLERHYYRDQIKEKNASQTGILSPIEKTEDLISQQPGDAPPEQINYLQNSNNIHDVFRSNPDPRDALRQNVNNLPRKKSPSDGGSASRSRSAAGNRHSRQYVQELPRDINNYHFNPDTLNAPNMQQQAFDFVNVLKTLITDTMNTQQQFQSQMFPQPGFTPRNQLASQLDMPPEGFTPTAEEQKQKETQLHSAALKHTEMIQTYMTELDQLRAQKEHMMHEELTHKIRIEAGLEDQEAAAQGSTIERGKTGYGKSLDEAVPAMKNKEEKEQAKQAIAQRRGADLQLQRQQQSEAILSQENMKKGEFEAQVSLKISQAQSSLIAPQQPPEQPLPTFNNGNGIQTPRLPGVDTPMMNQTFAGPPEAQKPATPKFEKQPTEPQIFNPAPINLDLKNQKSNVLGTPPISDQLRTTEQPAERKIMTAAMQKADLKAQLDAVMEAKTGKKTVHKDPYDQSPHEDYGDEEEKKGIFEDAEVVGFDKPRDVRQKEQEVIQQYKAQQRAIMQENRAAEQVGGFDHSRTMGPKGEEMVKHVVHRLPVEEDIPIPTAEKLKQVQPEDNLLNASQDSHVNLASKSGNPRHTINQDLINQIRNNFLTYDDYKVFQSGLPPSLAPPLRPDQSNYPTDPPPNSIKHLLPDYVNQEDDLEQYMTGDPLIDRKKRDILRKRFQGMDFRIGEDIEKVMKDNFEYEQKTVDTLFHRYQKYKPLISGIYGQDVVQTTAHHVGDNKQNEELDQMMSMKELETKALIEHMKGNYTTEQINLAREYETINDNNELFFGRQKDGINLTADEGPEQEEKKYQGFVIQEGKKTEIIKPGDDYVNEMLYKKYQTIFNKDTGPADFNLAANPEELEEIEEEQKAEGQQQVEKETDAKTGFPTTSVQTFLKAKEQVIDSDAIKDRITTLKLMFDDSKELRKQREFLNTLKVRDKVTPEPITSLDLVQEFNINKNVVTRSEATKQPEERKEGSRMISGMIKDIRAQKEQLQHNQEQKKQFEENLLSNKDVFNQAEAFHPDLTMMGKQIDAHMPESLHEAYAGPIKPNTNTDFSLVGDFKFDQDKYDKDKMEIQDLATKRNAENDMQIHGLVEVKSKQEEAGYKTILQKLEEQSKDLQISRIRNDKALKYEATRKIAGTDFNYNPLKLEEKTALDEVDKSFTKNENVAPSYSFMARNVFMAALGETPNSNPDENKAQVLLLKENEQKQIHEIPPEAPVEVPPPEVVGPPKDSTDLNTMSVPKFNEYNPPELRVPVLNKIEQQVVDHHQSRQDLLMHPKPELGDAVITPNVQFDFSLPPQNGSPAKKTVTFAQDVEQQPLQFLNGVLETVQAQGQTVEPPVDIGKGAVETQPEGQVIQEQSQAYQLPLDEEIVTQLEEIPMAQAQDNFVESMFPALDAVPAEIIAEEVTQQPEVPQIVESVIEQTQEQPVEIPIETVTPTKEAPVVEIVPEIVPPVAQTPIFTEPPANFTEAISVTGLDKPSQIAPIDEVVQAEQATPTPAIEEIQESPPLEVLVENIQVQEQEAPTITPEIPPSTFNPFSSLTPQITEEIVQQVEQVPLSAVVEQQPVEEVVQQQQPPEQQPIVVQKQTPPAQEQIIPEPSELLNANLAQEIPPPDAQVPRPILTQSTVDVQKLPPMVPKPQLQRNMTMVKKSPKAKEVSLEDKNRIQITSERDRRISERNSARHELAKKSSLGTGLLNDLENSSIQLLNKEGGSQSQSQLGSQRGSQKALGEIKDPREMSLQRMNSMDKLGRPPISVSKSHAQLPPLIRKNSRQYLEGSHVNSTGKLEALQDVTGSENQAKMTNAPLYSFQVSQQSAQKIEQKLDQKLTQPNHRKNYKDFGEIYHNNQKFNFNDSFNKNQDISQSSTQTQNKIKIKKVEIKRNQDYQKSRVKLHLRKFQNSSFINDLLAN